MHLLKTKDCSIEKYKIVKHDSIFTENIPVRRNNVVPLLLQPLELFIITEYLIQY